MVTIKEKLEQIASHCVLREEYNERLKLFMTYLKMINTVWLSYTSRNDIDALKDLFITSRDISRSEDERLMYDLLVKVCIATVKVNMRQFNMINFEYSVSNALTISTRMLSNSIKTEKMKIN